MNFIKPVLMTNFSSTTPPLGQWEEGMKQGEGKMSFFEGREYEGSWFRNRCHGKGKMAWASGPLLLYEVWRGKKGGGERGRRKWKRKET